MSILHTILKKKREEIGAASASAPLVDIKRRCEEMPHARPFRAALMRERLAVIAEVKNASPSRGVFRESFDPVGIAKDYQSGGADALSVLTDREFFQGRNDFLTLIQQAVELPILRKDFIIDEYQIYESRMLGADAILLIVKALSRDQLADLYRQAGELGLDVLIEVHTEKELQHALDVSPRIIGINNRDLETFEVSLDRSLTVRQLVPSGITTVSESGIRTRQDMQRLRTAGFDAVLIGEGLVTSVNPRQYLQELVRE